MSKYVITVGAVELVRGKPVTVEADSRVDAMTRIGATVWTEEEYQDVEAKMKELVPSS